VKCITLSSLWNVLDVDECIVRSAADVDQVPVLQYTFGITRDDLACLSRVLLHCYNWYLARFSLILHLARLPVPEAYIATAIAGTDVLSIRTDCHIWRVTSIVVTSVSLVLVLSELTGGGYREWYS
jgi:hypothetical protein